MSSLEQRFSRYSRYLSNDPEAKAKLKRRPQILQKYMDEAIAAGNFEIVDAVFQMTNHAVSTFGNHYHLDTPTHQIHKAQELVRVYRDTPHLTTLQSAIELLKNKNVGPYMTLIILHSILNFAGELHDLYDPERKERKLEYHKREIKEGKRITYPYHFSVTQERGIIQTITAHLYPQDLARIIGVSVEEFRSNPLYEEIWDTAQAMHPYTGNPYERLGRTRLAA